MYELIVLIVIVIGIVVVTAKWKVSPLLALLGAAFVAAFAYSIPMGEVVTTITDSFGRTIGNIGLVILVGTMLGTILERSGAAISMADFLVRILGPRFPNLTMSLVGYIVSIPVFCDSGFIILNSLRKAITVKTGVSHIATGVALMTGFYATHTLVPPTPGPLAAAENIGISHNLGFLLMVGLPVALVAAMAGLFYASRFSHSDLPLLPPQNGSDDDKTYEELRASYGKLPGTLASFLPILIPLILIMLSSIAKLPSQPFGGGFVTTLIIFLGTPLIALLLGTGAAVTLLRGNGKLEQFNKQIATAINVSRTDHLHHGRGRRIRLDPRWLQAHRFPCRGSQFARPRSGGSVPDRCRTQDGAGLLDSLTRHHVCHDAAATALNGSRFRDRDGAHRARDWCGFHGGFARERLLLLGLLAAQPDSCGNGVQDADRGFRYRGYCGVRNGLGTRPDPAVNHPVPRPAELDTQGG